MVEEVAGEQVSVVAAMHAYHLVLVVEFAEAVVVKVDHAAAFDP